MKRQSDNVWAETELLFATCLGSPLACCSTRSPGKTQLSYPSTVCRAIVKPLLTQHVLALARAQYLCISFAFVLFIYLRCLKYNC